MKTLKVGSEITEVGDFEMNPETVSSYAEIPPACADNTFTAFGAQLRVPAVATEAYFTAPGWKNFSNITNDLTEKVRLSQTEAKSIVGDKLQLKATTIPADKANEVVWNTTNPAVATVDSIGLVTLHAAGECRIFASLASDLAVYASCFVEVNSGAASGDVSGDGKVDVEDVNAWINLILKQKTADDYPGASDVTGDVKTDVEDVNAIINLILGVE